jgi:hypothetical protein
VGPDGGVKTSDRVLIVTTQIYAYQGVDAARTLGLPHGVKVEWAGMNPGDVDERLKQTFAPHNYLQEIRSMIRAISALHESIQTT